MHFNLAPLMARRGRAMLGLIHRTAIGKGGGGKTHFKQHFTLGPHSQIVDSRETLRGVRVKRSVLGLVAVYNMLPGCCTHLKKMSDSQTHLQDFLKNRAKEGYPEWITLSSPMGRGGVIKHPVHRK